MAYSLTEVNNNTEKFSFYNSASRGSSIFVMTGMKSQKRFEKNHFKNLIFAYKDITKCKKLKQNKKKKTKTNESDPYI